MKSKNEDEGRRMPRSDDISTKKETFERIVKIGDPSSKIVDLAEKQDIELIIMRSTGVGGSDRNLGHVTRKVPKITSEPISFIQVNR
jgi:nucleotide-binding universal stress UspA family protein